MVHVRDATVGPLLGTSRVSGWPTSTSSYPTPRASAAICAKMVLVPWPISVLAAEHAQASLRPWPPRPTTDARCFSPDPVKPVPCRKRRQAHPAPHRVSPARSPSAKRARFSCHPLCGERAVEERRACPCGRAPPVPSRASDPAARSSAGAAPREHMPRRRAITSMWRSSAKMRLRRAEAAEGAVRGRVGGHGARADVHVVDVVGPCRVDAPSREDDLRERRVRAAVDHEVDVHRDDASVPGHRGKVARAGRMALGRRRHVLGAVVDHLHRAPGLPREEGRVRRRSSTDTPPCRRTRRRSRAARRAPSPAALPEELHQRLLDVIGALHRAPHGDAAFGVRSAAIIPFGSM